MSDTKCEACGARGNHIPPDGGIFEKHLAYEARLRAEVERLKMELERAQQSLAQIAEALGDYARDVPDLDLDGVALRASEKKKGGP